MDNLQVMLAWLDELQSQRNIILMDKQSAVDKVLPAEVKAELEAIDLEFDGMLATVDEQIERAKEQIRPLVVAQASTVKSRYLSAIYNRGRITYDTDALDKYAQSHPEILQYRKVGFPTVSFKLTGGK
jgi:hypothetical protein